MLSAEPAGANCAWGGTRADAGLDADGSGTLDPAEISSTSYVCNASSGWLSVTGAQQMLSNGSYVASDDGTPVELTLPASPALGDVVTITGAGAAGWKVRQNAGQSILTRGVPGSPELGRFHHTSAGAGAWTSVAVPDDGSRVYAMRGTSLYMSRDDGLTWSLASDYFQANVPSATGGVIATSATGQRILVGLQPTGGAYLSQDWGASWQQLPPASVPDNVSYVAVAMADSSPAMILSDGNAVISTADGVTWRQYLPGAHVSDVAMDAGGSTGRASTDDGSDLQLVWSMGSTNFNAPPVMNGSSLAMSANGRIFVSGRADGPPTGVVVFDLDGGGGVVLLGGAGSSISDVAISNDGRRILAAGASGRLYASHGVNANWDVYWAGRGTATDVTFGASPRVAMSGDGEKLFAVSGEGIAASIAHRTVPGEDGFLAGQRGDSVSLQYIGNGQFIVLNYTLNNGSFTIE